MLTVSTPLPQELPDARGDSGRNGQQPALGLQLEILVPFRVDSRKRVTCHTSYEK
jgi:hypothetical protein